MFPLSALWRPSVAPTIDVNQQILFRLQQKQRKINRFVEEEKMSWFHDDIECDSPFRIFFLSNIANTQHVVTIFLEIKLRHFQLGLIECRLPYN